MENVPEQLFYKVDGQASLSRFPDDESPLALTALTRILCVTRWCGRATGVEFVDVPDKTLYSPCYSQSVSNTYKFGQSRFGDKIIVSNGDSTPFDANYIVAHDGSLWEQRKPLESGECWLLEMIINRGLRDQEQRSQEILNTKYERKPRILPLNPTIFSYYVAHPESMAQKEGEFAPDLGLFKVADESFKKEEIEQLFPEKAGNYRNLNPEDIDERIFPPFTSPLTSNN